MSTPHSSDTPLWLDLRKEYIDDNFERLVNYLHTASKVDSFYQTTLELLRQRVDKLIEDITERPLVREEDELEERVFNIRLLATFLLSETDDSQTHMAFTCLVNELMAMVPKFSGQLLETEMERMKHEKVLSMGFTWDDIKNFSVEPFTYKFISHHSFGQPLQEPLWIDERGSLCMDRNGISLLTAGYSKGEELVRNGVPSLECGFGFKVKTPSGNKLKVSLSEDMDETFGYAEEFSNKMKYTTVEVPRKKLYELGDRLLVEITSVRGNTLFARSIDPKYEEVTGPVISTQKSLVYYYVSTFPSYIKPGDIIPVDYCTSGGPAFSIEKSFVEFVVEDFREQFLNEPIHSMLIDSNPKKNQMVWLQFTGTPIYTAYDSYYHSGDFANVRGTRINEGKWYGKIDGEILDPVDEYFAESEARKSCLEAFASECPVYQEQAQKQHKTLDSSLLTLFTKLLFSYQRHVMKTIERVRLLSLARIMARMHNDDDTEEYIGFCSQYLRALVMFNKNEDVSEARLTPPDSYRNEVAVLKRCAVVELLSKWGHDNEDKALADSVITFQDVFPTLSRLARLIQTSNNLKGLVADSVLGVLKREVINLLSIEMLDDSDLNDEGIFMGVESGTVEFKESIIFPSNNGMQPDEHAQLMNVMKGVCAFLNSTTGGTLYLGVTDQGYVKGIQNDMKYLRMNDIDTYMRLRIQDRAKSLFGLDVIACITLEPMHDNQVVAIHVEPYPYHIVELDGKAYLRINAESREMTESLKAQVIDRKMLNKKEKATNITVLYRAIQEKHNVILHGYSSSHSGVISDRKVEAYDIDAERNLLYALDLDAGNVCKVFNINRVSNVEILDTPWQFEHLHQPIQVDAFRMSGTKPIHCHLQLDLMAKNLLLEEYPTAKSSLTKGKDDNEWFLDTQVYNIAGIGRYYIGLANHIEILDAPELKSFAINYMSQIANKL